MSKVTTINWFRNDLRLSDNPALHKAAKDGSVLAVYILDDENSHDQQLGEASRCWLHYSLQDLNKQLQGKLHMFRGNPCHILPTLVKQYKINYVNWNRCYEPSQIIRDTKLKQILKELGVIVNSYNGSLLWEPWQVLKKDGTPYRVFTPFYHYGCLMNEEPRYPIPKPKQLILIGEQNQSANLDSLQLLPKYNWYEKLILQWGIGEIAAQEQLTRFLEKGIHSYKTGRDYPARQYVSRLSPHLHFGEISPNQLWYYARECELDNNVLHFCREIAWREFSYNLLYYNPTIPVKNLQSKFDRFPWATDYENLIAWKSGKTGIPIVDAGMRELWQTGYMHNRVRMIVGSFLVKNLLIDWREGAKWFWDCLFDADLANNNVSWQWVAGCGADAAPYFRIFNPIIQGCKFDSEGEYTRKFIPELKLLPNKYLFNPWEAPINVLRDSKVELGVTYPFPIVDLSLSRVNALSAFKNL